MIRRKFFCKPDELDYLPLPQLHYDDIVDKTDFRPDSELTRAQRLAGSSGNLTDNAMYDYQDGRIPDNDSVTPELIALREGRLDKADIQKLQSALESKIDKDTAEAETAKVLKQSERVAKARQEYLDGVTGFDSSTVSDS